MNEIKLGQKAKDIITGFEGIIVGKADYLYGCSQYGIVPQLNKDGKRGDCEWFDEGRIRVLGKGVLPKSVRVEKNGADRDNKY